jgi:peptidyl-prolyl cis-trans isomerase A (cyclophilin A)
LQKEIWKIKLNHKGQKVYDGLKFHRSNSDFYGSRRMSSRCRNWRPDNDDEFHPSLKHDRQGVLAANSSWN